MGRGRQIIKIGLALFLLGGVIGFWILSLQGETYLEHSGMLSEYFIRQYKYLDVDAGELFYYILEKRGIWPVLVWVLGYTVIGAAVAGICCGWLGILAGILLGVGTARFGIGGVFFCICAGLPQCLFYIPAWALLLAGVWQKWRRRERKPFSLKSIDWRYGGVLLCTTVLFLLGILTESYINPWLMQWVLQFF